MQKNTQKAILRLLLTALGILLILVGAYILFRALGWTDISREGLQEFIAARGVIAPVIFIIVSILQVTFVPIPGAVTVVAGCYVFGMWRAFLYSYVGMMIGSLIAFWLGKRIGRPFVNWLVGGREKTDEWLERFKDREKVLLFFMFLFPGFPDDMLCSVAGVLPISWGTFIAMQIVTRATSIGATVLLLSGDIIPYHGWGLVVLGVLALLAVPAFLLCFKYASAINAICAYYLERLTAHFKRPSRKKEACAEECLKEKENTQ